MRYDDENGLIKQKRFTKVGQFSKYKLRRNDRSSDSIIQLVGQLGSIRHFKLPSTSSSESNCTFHFNLRNSLQIRIPPLIIDFHRCHVSRISKKLNIYSKNVNINYIYASINCLFGTENTERKKRIFYFNFIFTTIERKFEIR